LSAEFGRLGPSHLELQAIRTEVFNVGAPVAP
jgi:hypothetical protein